MDNIKKKMLEAVEDYSESRFLLSVITRNSQLIIESGSNKHLKEINKILKLKMQQKKSLARNKLKEVINAF